VAAVGDDESVFELKHRVREELRGTDTSSAKGAYGHAEDVDLQQSRAMVVCIRDAKLFTQVPEAVVNPPVGHANVVRPHSCFGQYVGTEVVGPVNHTIFETRLVESIEKQSEGVNFGFVLKPFGNPPVQAVFCGGFVIHPCVSLVHVVVTSTSVGEIVHQAVAGGQRV
jgi:hypothetical protein